MFDFLDKLRSKPEHVRRKIAYGAVAMLMLPVIGIWGSTIHAELTTPQEVQAVYDKNSPGSALLQTGSAFWSGIKDSFRKSKEHVTTGFEQLNEGDQAASSSSSLVGTSSESSWAANGTRRGSAVSAGSTSTASSTNTTSSTSSSTGTHATGTSP